MSQTKKLSVEFEEKDLASMLYKVMPNFHNKELLSQYIASSFTEFGGEYAAELIKIISGAKKEMAYVKGMRVYVNYYAGISTWDIDKDKTEYKTKARRVNSNFYLSCVIVDVICNKLKSYQINYDYVNSDGEKKVGTGWVQEKDLKPLIEI